MDQDRRGQTLNTSYSLRRQVVPSKRFDDFYLERKPVSKNGNELTRESGEDLDCTSSQTPLPVPSLCEDSLSCRDNSSALPQHFPASSLPADNGWESTCKVSEATLFTVPEASECVGHKSIPVAPCKEQAEQGLDIHNVPLVAKLCSSVQKSVNSHASVSLNLSPSHGEPQQSSQIPRDSTPQAPKVKKAKVAPQRPNLKQRLETAAMPLQLPQDVPALIPEARCTINLQKELLIQKCYSKRNHSTSGPKRRTSVKDCDCQVSGCDTKRCKKGVKHTYTGKHRQKRKHDIVLDSGPVMGPEWLAARDKEDMFFPHLQDSSLMAEAKERKTRDLALESSLRQAAEPLEERYIKNAAVLPDLRPLPSVAPSPAQSNPPPSAAQSESLFIDGHTMEDYKAIYHSVVDPMLRTKSGSTHQYNLGMGRAIKQRLWEKMSCPTLVESVDADGRVHISETFSPPSLKSFAPYIDIDISGEPLPGQPKKKRARLTS